MDDIGFYKYLANYVSGFFGVMALLFFGIFYRLNMFVAFVFASILLNIAALNYWSNSSIVQISLIIIWPSVNILLVVYGMVIFFRKRLGAKRKI